MKVQKPVFGEITQGTLFNCAIADRYRGKRVHGLGITARCDIANDKYPVLNYLPVVTLFDWMHCDGFEILFGNALKSQRGSFEGTLKQAGVATSVLASIPRQEVVSSFFDDENASRQQKKLAGKAHEQANRLDALEALSADSSKDRNWFLDTYEKEASALVKELVQHKVPSFYFIPSVTDENENDGHVILLRESAFLPRSIAKEVANGVDRPEKNDSELGIHLSFEFDDFAMPVGQVPSPNIEHILQTFSYMFGRIGLENYTADFISDVCGRKFVKKGIA
ncbi:hypothetical protein [Gymnodinialimonas sp. 57CJ19]|uniref:hypothetical protein n=1 Tax=Gymnodinialimonas sp. 57CJ19 TaxID=3138498 RepID=UPI0031342BCD